MYFYNDYLVDALIFKRYYLILIFISWKVDTKGKYAVAIIGTLLLAIAIEGLNFLRYHL